MEGWIPLDLSHRRAKPPVSVREQIKGAMILHPVDREPGNKALDTIGRMLSGIEGKAAIILLSHCAGLITEAAPVNSLLDYAKKNRYCVWDLPDVSLSEEEDGSVLLWGRDGFFYLYTRGMQAFPSPLDAAFELIEKCKRDVRKEEILAIVYNQEADWQECQEKE